MGDLHSLLLLLLVVGHISVSRATLSRNLSFGCGCEPVIAIAVALHTPSRSLCVVDLRFRICNVAKYLFYSGLDCAAAYGNLDSNNGQRETMAVTVEEEHSQRATKDML